MSYQVVWFAGVPNTARRAGPFREGYVMECVWFMHLVCGRVMVCVHGVCNVSECIYYIIYIYIIYIMYIILCMCVCLYMWV